MKNNYDEIVEKWSANRSKGTINKCIIDFCDMLNEKSKILDVGCGDGFIDVYLNNRGFDVVAIDPSLNMIKSAKKLNLKNVEFINTDLFTFSSNTLFDGIIAFDSLWHIPYDQQKSIYSKLSSLLKINGYLIFTHGKKSGQLVDKMFDEDFYYSSLDLDELHILLKENQFKIISEHIDYVEASTGSRELLMICQKV